MGRPAGLEEGDVMDWLLRASGVRALINQTDVRLALARRGRSAGSEEAGLILRGHFRSRGEVGPFLLRRKRADGDGEPLGYERFAAHAGLLENAEQEAFFACLPEAFSYKDLRLLWGKSNESAQLLVHKMMRLGLVPRTAYALPQRGVYGLEYGFRDKSSALSRITTQVGTCVVGCVVGRWRRGRRKGWPLVEI
jgi:hypothetical protein